MFRKLPIALALVLVMILAAAPAAMAAKPVRGDMDLTFNLNWSGPQTAIPDWVGTITIGAKDYDMAFYAFGNGKPFEGDPSGSVHFFEEIWEVYAHGSMVAEWDDAGGVDPNTFKRGVLLLKGYDRGLTNLKNAKYHMTGYVQVANPPFAGLAGRNVYMRGTIVWDGSAPQFAPGTLRIN